MALPDRTMPTDWLVYPPSIRGQVGPGDGFRAGVAPAFPKARGFSWYAVFPKATHGQ